MLPKTKKTRGEKRHSQIRFASGFSHRLLIVAKPSSIVPSKGSLPDQLTIRMYQHILFIMYAVNELFDRFVSPDPTMAHFTPA